MPNKLSTQSSPYLLQHQSNPVDWQPWDIEAFAQAVAEQKPVFLSVGYSSCHWCHVMEHESFEDTEIAEILNRSFVSIKVDREERPDIDDTYMTAVQMASGRGGWPMSVFLTPDKKPFFAGTYFPKEDRQGQAGFKSILLGIERHWNENHEELIRSASKFAETLEETFNKQPERTLRDQLHGEQLLTHSVAAILDDYDPKYGGFGQSPKFPPHSALVFLLEYSSWPNADPDLAQRAINAAGFTLKSMSQGGIMDHVGGGFHRYSTDAMWHLPHFEKMLYDNALILKPLMMAGSAIPTFAWLYEKTAERTVDWLKREMLTSDGLLGSALDADSEGEEGKYYVWSIPEIENILSEDTEEFAKAYRCTPEGNFLDEATRQQTGTNVLHQHPDSDDRWGYALDSLLTARDARPKPLFDHKAIVCWNALAVVGIVAVGFGEFATEIMENLLKFIPDNGEVPHLIVDGIPSGRGFLDDYAATILALHALAEVSGGDLASSYYRKATRLTQMMISEFLDTDHTVFRATGSGHEPLFGRAAPIFDQPIPSGNALGVRALILAGETDLAAKVLAQLSGWMQSVPSATEGLLSSYLRLVSGQGVLNSAPAVMWSLDDQSLLLHIKAGVHLRSVTLSLMGGELIVLPEQPENGYENILQVVLPDSAKSGSTLNLRYQPCTDWECLLPIETDIVVD